MYVSDYAYAADSNYWNLTVSRYTDITGDNWMYMGDIEWTISRDSSNTYGAFSVFSFNGGGVGRGFVSNASAVRPSFSLASTVTISSGTGTSSDPFVLNLG